MGRDALKKCCVCKKEKPTSEFYKRLQIYYQAQCKACQAKINRNNSKSTNTRNREKRRENWQKIFEHFGGRKCQACGIESEYPIYDLHHKDPAEKDVGVGAIAHHSWEKVKAEVEKCVLLCSNCHRIEHAKERE